MTLFIPTAQQDTATNGFVDAFDTSGLATLVVYDDTIPPNANDAISSGSDVLATLTYSATAFGASSAGVATAASIASDTSADQTGTATYFRCYAGSGETLCQGGVGTSGQELNLNTVSISLGATVAITSQTVTHPAS